MESSESLSISRNSSRVSHVQLKDLDKDLPDLPKIDNLIKRRVTINPSLAQRNLHKLFVSINRKETMKNKGFFATKI